MIAPPRRFSSWLEFGAFLVLFLIGVTLVVYAAASYRVNNGTTGQVDESSKGYCLGVANNSGKDIFVPTNTGGEIGAFQTHLPAGVTTYDLRSDYSSACCWAGSTCNGSGWTTYDDCARHVGGASCPQNSHGCWGDC